MAKVTVFAQGQQNDLQNTAQSAADTAAALAAPAAPEALKLGGFVVIKSDRMYVVRDQRSPELGEPYPP